MCVCVFAYVCSCISGAAKRARVRVRLIKSGVSILAAALSTSCIDMPRGVARICNARGFIDTLRGARTNS